MGFMDKLRKTTDKAVDAVADNEEKIDAAIDKAVNFADDKTRGKYSDKIDKAANAARKGVDKVAEKSEKGSSDSAQPSTDPPAADGDPTTD
ncbi:MAG: antitoxin [Acidimicrobiia bacterium]|nr:antitoxin [Acidimicrobiia bacterium]